MPKIVFYRQKRQDGGVRTAVTIDDETVFHQFEEGADDPDPTLLWFVDVRCLGRKLPRDSQQARLWLLQQAPTIKRALGQLAEKLAAGLDAEPWPFLWKVPNPPRGAELVLACSAVRRVNQLEIAAVLTDVRDRWEELVKKLPMAEPALP